MEGSGGSALGIGYGLACAGLMCLFVVSAVVLAIVLVRQNRKNSADD